MRIESQVTVCALNDRHGASFARRQPTLDVPSPIRVEWMQESAARRS